MPADPSLRAISITTVDNRWDRKGKRKRRGTELVKNLLLPSAEYTALFDRLGTEVPAAAE